MTSNSNPAFCSGLSIFGISLALVTSLSLINLDPWNTPFGKTLDFWDCTDFRIMVSWGPKSSPVGSSDHAGSYPCIPSLADLFFSVTPLCIFKWHSLPPNTSMPQHAHTHPPTRARGVRAHTQTHTRQNNILVRITALYFSFLTDSWDE